MSLCEDGLTNINVEVRQINHRIYICYYSLDYDLTGNVNSVSVCPKVKESLVMFFTEGQIILDI